MDLSLSAQSVAGLIGVLIPIFVSLLAKLNAPDGVKVVLNLGLTAVAGVIGTLVASDGNFDVNAFATAWLTAFVASITAYYGGYKPLKAAQKITNATPNLGFGQGPADDAPPLPGDDAGDDLADDDDDLPVDEG